MQYRNFGKMAWGANTSGFLLDFGRVLVIEFSEVGNAAYVYDQTEKDAVVPNFWSEASFQVRDLKRKDAKKHKVNHHAGWERDMRGILARYGIRPDSH